MLIFGDTGRLWSTFLGQERGLVRAVGISTHTVRGRQEALVPEIDVIVL